MEIDVCENDGNDDAKDICANLRKSIPLLEELFHIHRKVGEGAFSSVFLATLKSSNGRKKFALKHLIPTCHPERIERELRCLQEIGGKEYIVGLELCLRNHGSVVFVMPYMRHDKFPDYVRDMTVEETKDYMRALLSALRRVHKFNIIHRDVKPSNFLYDRINRRYLLIDFGLAQQSTVENFKAVKETTIKSMEIIPAMKRKRLDENNLQLNTTTKRIGDNKCMCFGKPKVCSLCSTRPPEQAPRAGTPGFRAPEVLLKHPSQTSAIDIWASGVMMLCILSSTQPFFRSPDDCTALAEITSMFGTCKMQQCAQKLGKKVIFSDNLPGIDIMPLCQKLQKRNRSMTYDRDSTCKEKVEYNHTQRNNEILSFLWPKNINSIKSLRISRILVNSDLILTYWKVLPDIEYPKEAYHLLTKLLDLDYKTRITAEQALSHPFLSS